MPPQSGRRARRRFGPALLVVGLLCAPSAALSQMVPEAILQTPSKEPFSGFGSSLAIDGGHLVVGAPWESDAAGEALHVGAAYVYAYHGGRWLLGPKLEALGGASGDYFGHAVAIDGDRIAVGAPGESDAAAGKLSRGAVYLFERTQAGWSQLTRFGAGAAAFSHFGHAVDIDGARVAVGVPGDGEAPGSVFIYEQVEGVWTYSRLDGLAPGDRFGSSVALDGDALAVAERGGASWRSFVKGSLDWIETGQQHGAAPGFAGALAGTAARIVVGAEGDDVTSAGEVHFFALDGNSWQLEEVEAPLLTGPGDRFGAAVALDGQLAILGSPLADVGASPDSGTAHLYSRSPGGDWQLLESLDGGSPSAGQRFGAAVALDGAVMAVGAPGYADLEAEDGRVFLYRRDRVASFSASPRLGCAPLQVTFTDHSVGDITSREWDVDGDGTVDYVNPGLVFSHTYTTPGSYLAELTVGGPGLSDSDELSVEVGSGAVAAFTATPLTGPAPLTVTFTDQSTGPIVERRWDLDGDGQVDIVGNQTSVVFTYQNPGLYSPTLEAISACGTSTVSQVDLIEATATIPTGPVVLNPSFEANGTVIFGVGAVNQGNPIAHWQFSNTAKIGRNAKGLGHPFYNNGDGRDGNVAAYVKDAVLSQQISGFAAGVTYRLSFHVNARALQAPPNLKVRLGGQQLLDEKLSPVDPIHQHQTPFRVITVDHMPGAGTHLLEIEQDRSIFAGLLIDLVEIEEAPIQNASFEDDGVATAGFGLISQGNVVSHWQASSAAQAGRNPEVVTNPPAFPFYNNGHVRHGQVAGFLKAGIYSQMVTGFEAGVTYRLTFHVNARALQAAPNLKVRLGGVQLMDHLVTPVDPLGVFTTPFRTFSADVSPGEGSFLLEIEQDRSIFAGLLIDFVDLQPLP